MAFKRNKYNAVKTRYNGVLYDSKKEANYAAELDLLVKAKEILGWDRQIKVPLYGLNGSLIDHWRIDFIVQYNDGSEEYHEVKGVETKDFKLKRDLFIDNYPDRRLLIIK